MALEVARCITPFLPVEIGNSSLSFSMQLVQTGDALKISLLIEDTEQEINPILRISVEYLYISKD